MSPFFEIGLFVTIAFFLFFLVLLPLFSLSEKIAYHLYIESAAMQINKVSTKLYYIPQQYIKTGLKHFNN